jgi:hypothetical protein
MPYSTLTAMWVDQSPPYEMVLSVSTANVHHLNEENERMVVLQSLHHLWPTQQRFDHAYAHESSPDIPHELAFLIQLTFLLYS